MSRLYTEDGQRVIGAITLAVIQGKEVHIRPATQKKERIQDRML